MRGANRAVTGRRTGNDSGILRGVLVLCAGVLALAGATPAAAQSRIPAHEIERDKSSGACSVSLIPEETYGDDPPRLTVITLGRSRADQVGLDAQTGRGTTDLTLVYKNARTEFRRIAPVSVKALTNSQLWKTIDESAKQKRPFFLTSKTADGRYASARYENIEPLGIIAILEAQCSFSSSTLTAATPDQLRAKESALALSGDQLRHIRWVLNSRYGSSNSTPIPASILTTGERGYLERYARDIGQPKTRYLTEVLANRLLREEFRPRAVNRAGNRGYSRLKDWETYRWTTDRCAVSSAAISWSGLNLYVRPEILFTARDRADGNAIFFDMVTPNPFRTGSTVTLVVDGRSYRLQWNSGRLLPRRDGDGVSDETMKAFRRGNNIEFRGTSKDSGRPASVYYSASGFTGAFNQMMRDCRRPALRDWFN